MDEKEKARRDFWDEYKLDELPPKEAGAMCFSWVKGFDKGRGMAGGKGAGVSIANHNGGTTRFSPKSDGATTGYINKVNESAELALGLSVIALTISVVALITVVVHLF